MSPKYGKHDTKQERVANPQGEEHMTIEAMKQALEALESTHDVGCNKTDEAIISLRQAIEQAEKQEPVAWMRQDGQRVTTASDRHNYPDGETRYSIPLYTHPQPQREWVGLTEEEIQQVFIANSVMVDNGNTYMVAGLRAVIIGTAIEAKLKEKNT
jgi:beta-N-acetylglucosaminidase